MNSQLFKLYWVNNSDIILEAIKILDRDIDIISPKRITKIQNFLDKYLTKDWKPAVENLHDIITLFPELRELEYTFETKAQKSFDDMMQHMSDYYMSQWKLDEANEISKQIS